MLAPAGPSEPQISADPAALERFAGGSGGRTRDYEAAIATADQAVNAWNRADCDPRFHTHVQPPGPLMQGLGQAWAQGDDLAVRVAAGFRAADADGGTVRKTTQTVLDQKLAADSDYNPISGIVQGDKSAWARQVGANICYRNGGKYLGGGFIKGPDGRMYPLVIPEVTVNGKQYNADNGAGDVATLDGADPGWFQTSIYTNNRALFSTDKTGIAIASAIINATGGTSPTGKAGEKSDYAGLRIGDGPPRWIAGADGQSPSFTGGEKPGPVKFDEPKTGGPKSDPAPISLTRGAAGAAAIGYPVKVFNQTKATVDNAENSHYGAYQVKFERNLDGRVRARLTIYAIKKEDDGTRVIAPIGVGGGGSGEQVGGKIIQYKPYVEPPGGTPDTVREKSGEYKILKGFKENNGFFADPDEPIKDTYQ